MLGTVLELVAQAVGEYPLQSEHSFSTGDPPEFEEIFDSATQTIAEDPNNAQAYFARGVVCQSKGWHPDAVADFVEVVKLDPKNARAWLLMSEVLSSMGESEKSKVARQQALEIDPSVS
jgi:tetratricopeptide (TPR) repeat protein